MKASQVLGLLLMMKERGDDLDEVEVRVWDDTENEFIDVTAVIEEDIDDEPTIEVQIATQRDPGSWRG